MPEIDGDHAFGFDTLSVHAGQRPDTATGARAVPIVASAAIFPPRASKITLCSTRSLLSLLVALFLSPEQLGSYNINNLLFHASNPAE
ncbi:MAG: hypothetical protein NVS4B12_27220 [Ktedonobacteraceae bacterium]